MNSQERTRNQSTSLNKARVLVPTLYTTLVYHLVISLPYGNVLLINGVYSSSLRTQGGKAGSSESSIPKGWDRDRDLGIQGVSSEADVRKMVKAAGEMGDRFAAPSMSRNFL